MLLLVLLLISVCVSQAWASEEQSELLYTKGLVPFGNGDDARRKALSANRTSSEEAIAFYREALVLFQQAVAEDAPYFLAVYYLGVTYGKLGRFAEAIPYLEKTRHEHPELTAAKRDLAIVYYHVQRYHDALQLLATVERTDPNSSSVLYYMAMCHYALGAKSEGDRALARTTQLNPEANPQSKSDKPWELRLGVEAGFDSNVLLQPNSGAAVRPRREKDDFRFLLSAGGSVDLWRASSTYLTVHYDFFADVHPDISNFDLQGHRLRLTSGWSPTPAINLSLDGGTNYYRVGDRHYLHELYFQPALGMFAAPWAYTLLAYRLTDQNYLISYFDPARDGLRHEASARQYVLFDGFEQFLFFGYQYQRENPSLRAGRDFQYSGHEFEVGGRVSTLWNTAIELTYSFHNRNFQFANSRSVPPLSRARDDDAHAVSFILRKPLTPQLEVYLSYLGTWNDSNLGVFAYRRHLGSLGVRVVY